MVWWILLAVLVGLAILPLGISAKYNAAGAYLAVIAGPVRIKLFPRKEKEEKPKKEKKQKKPKKTKTVKSQQAPAPQSAAPVASAQPKPQTLEEKYPDLEKKPNINKTIPSPSPDENGGDWKDFLSLVPIVLDFLGDFRRKLRINRLEMRLILAADDPCDLAVNYGKAWAAVGALLPQLERVFIIQKRDVEVECDFTASKTTVTARIDTTITLGRLLAITCKFAFRALKEYLNITKKRKGGACK